MAIKPDKTGWNPDPGDIQEPSGSKKSTGFLSDERPPYQFFNWFWDAKRRWENWLAPAVRHNIIISDNTDERDYATLAAYIADAPAVGDRVLITNNQVIIAQIIVPSDITLCIQDGIKFTSAIDLANSLIEFGDNVITEGVLVLELSHAGVVNSGIELNGDGNYLDVVIDNTSTGTLAIGALVNVAKTTNLLKGEVKNTGAGAVTTVLSDLSLDESNIIEIRDSINNIVDRSLGGLSFLTGITWDLGSDADGDIYYRDSGILKRLPKGGDGQVLQLDTGIPSWQTFQTTTSLRDSARNLLVVKSSVSEVDVTADEVFLQNSIGLSLHIADLDLTGADSIDITVAGAGGLDTGSEASSTWYYIWAINNGSTTKGLLSLSGTAPTLPGGYTFKALVGRVFNDSGSNFDHIVEADVFKSSEQTITANTAVTVPHGLGGVPAEVVTRLICKTAELGYSIGDIIYHPVARAVPENTIDSTFADGTSVGFIVDDSVFIRHKTNFGANSITLANWKFEFYAWRK